MFWHFTRLKISPDKIFGRQTFFSAEVFTDKVCDLPNVSLEWTVAPLICVSHFCRSMQASIHSWPLRVDDIFGLFSPVPSPITQSEQVNTEMYIRGNGVKRFSGGFPISAFHLFLGSFKYLFPISAFVICLISVSAHIWIPIFASKNRRFPFSALQKLPISAFRQTGKPPFD